MLNWWSTPASVESVAESGAEIRLLLRIAGIEDTLPGYACKASVNFIFYPLDMYSEGNQNESDQSRTGETQQDQFTIFG